MGSTAEPALHLGQLQGPRLCVPVPGDVSLTAPRRGSHPATLSSPGFSPCRSLDLTGPLLLGGVPNLPENFPVTHRDFVGCMRDLYIDSKRIDLASYIANNGTTTGTSTSDPCQRLSSGVRGRSCAEQLGLPLGQWGRAGGRR